MIVLGFIISSGVALVRTYSQAKCLGLVDIVTFWQDSHVLLRSVMHQLHNVMEVFLFLYNISLLTGVIVLHQIFL